MDLDPKLAALAAAAIAPTKMLIDFLTMSVRDMRPAFKLGTGYFIALGLIMLFQAYIGSDDTVSFGRWFAGDALAAYSTMQGAVLLTELQKRVAIKKTERRKKADKIEPPKEQV